jgi:uncharacterized integral membrane protein (TIGR00698 family)
VSAGRDAAVRTNGWGRPAEWLGTNGPGLVVAAAVAAIAARLGALVPVVGGPVLGIVIGMVIAAFRRPGPTVRPGLALAGRQGLQLSIVLLGTGLGLAQIVRTGAASLPVMLGTMAAALIGAWVFGRLLAVEGHLRTLVGVGTAICGASAVAAISGVLAAEEADIAYAISTIFVFNVVAVLLYPALGHLMGLSQSAFGLWAGTAINDTSSVVAAAYTFGPLAGASAVVVKLTRTTLISPVALALALAATVRPRTAPASRATGRRLHWQHVIPWFIVFFLAASLANTLGAFSAAERAAMASVANFLIVMALSAIGLSAEFGRMRRTGLRPLLLGAALWATVGGSSLLLQRLTGHL